MIQINSSLANKLNVSAGDTVVVEQEENSIDAPVMINDEVSDNGVLIQAAHVNHSRLGAWHGNVSLRKA
jgi:anaerobic selenocysteine-containing dehydrogenase